METQLSLPETPALQYSHILWKGTFHQKYASVDKVCFHCNNYRIKKHFKAELNKQKHIPGNNCKVWWGMASPHEKSNVLMSDLPQ